MVLSREISRGARHVVRVGSLVLVAAVGCGDDEAVSQGSQNTQESFDYDYIVVGSGAGGGPLASRLACSGQRVLLIEAGEDAGDRPTYQIPLFFVASQEDPHITWDYWAQFYSDPARQSSHPNHAPNGQLYNRGGTLGGSTAHNALISLRPAVSDWNAIADLTGDASWKAEAMDRYYGKVREWLSLEIPDPNRTLSDDAALALTAATIMKTVEMGYPGPTIDPANVKASAGDIRNLLLADVNDKLRDNVPIGVHSIPNSTKRGARNGSRERILQAQTDCKLTVKTSTLVTKVLLSEEASPRALGVEYMEGKNIYRADKEADSAAAMPARSTVKAAREVILSAGVFGTPQLLKLSGIGAKSELDTHKIPVRVDSPGVGENLQDRYEVSVIYDQPFKIYGRCTFATTPDDPCLTEWMTNKTGEYADNGIPVSALVKSSPDQPDPDLELLGFPFRWNGYFPGYSAAGNLAQWTWLVVKAHTKNRAGTVKLRSTDPRDYPVINFNYFDEGSVANGEDKADLEGVVNGIEMVRGMADKARTMPQISAGLKEVVPGPTVATRDQLREFVKKSAWGHHASCSAPIGRDGDPKAVLDSRFRVRGVSGLRVVDASVFPRIPGSFVVVPIYMVSEKAADVILEDQKK